MSKRDVRVEVVPITTLQPDPNNANAGTERGLAMIEDSLQQLGAGRSVLTDKHGVLMAGNKTHQQAVELGFEEAVVVHTDGRQLVVVQRDDLDLETDPRARRMALVDNRASEVSLAWSPAMLAAIAAEQPEAVKGLWTESEMEELLAATRNGEAIAAEQRPTLADRFIVPPFSVLDARQGYWQDRKRAWLALGIQSELGRGDATRPGSPGDTRPAVTRDGKYNGGDAFLFAGTHRLDHRSPNAAPGGSPRDAATLGKDGRTVRGDGKGRVLTQRERERVAPRMAMHNDPMQRKAKYDAATPAPSDRI